jgi:hypothetical protein
LSQGLTPPLYWKHHKELLQARREELAPLVKEILSRPDVSPLETFAVRQTGVSLGVGPGCSVKEDDNANNTIYISEARVEEDESAAAALSGKKKEERRESRLVVVHGKKGYASLFSQLGGALEFARATLARKEHLTVAGDEKEFVVAVTLAVLGQFLFLLLCSVTWLLNSFFKKYPASIMMGNSSLTPWRPKQNVSRHNIEETKKSKLRMGLFHTASKPLIRSRLQWILESTSGRISPSRRTLNRVNEYFIAP